MLKRTLFFGNPYHLHSRMGQMVIDDKTTGETRTAPIEDLGFVVFEHPQITFSQGLMQLMLKNNVAVIFCDEKYLPGGILLNLDGHQLQTARFRSQLSATEPLKKGLWKQTVQLKIRNQAAMLESEGIDGSALIQKAKAVKSGDPSNEEAKAAAVYWRRLMGQDFRRERFGEWPNPLLNYGYAILRAGVARALSGSGLHPTLGIFHRNQYNSFCLADDIMEPYRPFVDRLVVDYMKHNEPLTELDQKAKGHMLGVLSMDTTIGKRKRPLMLALSETTSSLAACYEGEKKKLKYASFI